MFGYSVTDGPRDGTGRVPQDAASTVVPAGTLLGRLDHDLLDLVLLLGLEADGDGEDAVVVARRDVVRVGVARQWQTAGERAVPELGPVLALGLVVPLGA